MKGYKCCVPNVPIIFLFLLFTNIVENADSQTSGPLKLQGRVLNTKDNQEIPSVSIAVKSTGKGTVANDKGYFSLEVPSDTSTIVISSIGYKTRSEKLRPSFNFSNFVIKLDEDIQQIDEVTVTAEKGRIVRVSDDISSVKISPKLIAKLPNLGEVDVMRSFQLLPGISATNESSSGLYVRGGTPDQNLVLFDGMTIYHVDHFFGFFSAFNANTIDDIELMKGGFPAKYGGRLSSVMEITGKPADLKKFNEGIGISLLSANAYAEIPIIKNVLSFQIAGRRSYSDIIQTGLYNKIFNLYNKTTTTTTIDPNTGSGPGGSFGSGQGPGGGRSRSFQQTSVTPTFHFYDLNSKLTFKPTSKDEMFVSFYNGEDKLDQSRNLSSGFTLNGSSGNLTDITNWGNLGVSGQWKRQWTKEYNSHVFISYSNYFNKTDRQYGNSASDTIASNQNANRAFSNANIDNKIKDFSIRLKNEWKISQSHLLSFGTEITHNIINYSGQRTDTLIVNGNANLYAWYVQDNISILKKIQLLIGYRGNYFQGTSKFYQEPRISIIYNLSKTISLKGAYGKYYQFISCVTQEDILQGNKEYWLLDNSSNVPVSYASHYIAGVNYENQKFLFSVEGYYKQLTNVLEESQRSTRNFFGPTNTYNIYAGTGVAKGIEFMAQKKYGNTTGWIGYTYGSVIYNYPDLNYGKSFYADQDQTHEFKAVAIQNIKQFDISATFVYGTGKPYTAPVSLYQLTMLDGSVNTYYHLYDKNGYRLPAYSRFDIAATYNWGIKAKKHLSLSIYNLFNHKNIWYKQFNTSGYQLNITDVSYLGITPNLSLSVDIK